MEPWIWIALILAVNIGGGIAIYIAWPDLTKRSRSDADEG